MVAGLVERPALKSGLERDVGHPPESGEVKDVDPATEELEAQQPPFAAVEEMRRGGRGEMIGDQAAVQVGAKQDRSSCAGGTASASAKISRARRSPTIRSSWAAVTSSKVVAGIFDRLGSRLGTISPGSPRRRRGRGKPVSPATAAIWADRLPPAE